MLVLGRVPWAIFLVFLPADWVHIAIVEFQWVQATFSESTRHVDNYELHTQDASDRFLTRVFLQAQSFCSNFQAQP